MSEELYTSELLKEDLIEAFIEESPYKLSEGQVDGLTVSMDKFAVAVHQHILDGYIYDPEGIEVPEIHVHSNLEILELIDQDLSVDANVDFNSIEVVDKIYTDEIVEYGVGLGINLGSDTLFVDQANGRVGIGETSLTYPLHIKSVGAEGTGASLLLEATAPGSIQEIRFLANDIGANSTSRILYDWRGSNYGSGLGTIGMHYISGRPGLAHHYFMEENGVIQMAIKDGGAVEIPNSLSVDTINEYTTDAGIIAEGVELKDGFISLDYISAPSGDKLFTMANKQLIFRWTDPDPTDGALELEAIGAFTGDLVHIHQHTGNPGVGTHLVHVEATDTDVNLINLTHGSPTGCILEVDQFGDANKRFCVDASGFIQWGNGTDMVDTSLYRSAANVLKTDDSLIVSGALGIGTAPSHPLHIVVNQNAATIAQIENTSSGVYSSSNLILKTGSEQAYFSIHGMNVSISRWGIDDLGGHIELTTGASGGRGIIVGTRINEPVIIGVNEIAVATYTSAGITLSAGATVNTIETTLTDDDTHSPTSGAVWDAIAVGITGGMFYKGGYNAATNTPDLDSSPSGVEQGDTYTVTADGIFFTEAVQAGDMIIAEIDDADELTEWTIVNKNIPPYEFINMTDTPSTWVGKGGFMVMVDSTPDALEFIDPSGYNLSNFNDDLGHNEMVYPGAGIALSTGSAWDTSITDNSADWNTALQDGDHWTLTGDPFLYVLGTNVGIGIAIPTSKLHIGGVGDSLIQVEKTGDSVSTLGQIGTGGYLQLREGVAGVANIMLRSYGDSYFLGNVGIGVTSPTQKLQIEETVGQPASSGTTSTAFLRLKNSAGSSLADFGLQSTSPYGLWIQSTHSGDLSVVYPLVLNPIGGNVGIGTTGPTELLHLDSGVGSTDIGLEGGPAGVGWRIRNDQGDSRFHIDAVTGSFDAFSAKFTILADGKTGIGTATPIKTLEVAGATMFGSTSHTTTGSTFFYGRSVAATIYNAYGSMYSSSNNLIGYGIEPKSGSSGYISTTTANIKRAYLEIGADLKYGFATSQTTAIGSDITGLSTLFSVDGDTGNVVVSGSSLTVGGEEVLTADNGMIKVDTYNYRTSTALGAISGDTGNIGIGHEAGKVVTGSYGVYIGYQAGAAGTSSYLVAIGYQAGYSNSTSGDIAIGFQAGYSKVIDSSGDVFIGYRAGRYVESVRNTMIGFLAGTGVLGNELTGHDNTIVGYYTGTSLRGVATGNTFLGGRAGQLTTTGDYNILVGYQAGDNILTGSYNIILGTVDALLSTGSYNFRVGNNGNLLLEGSMVVDSEYLLVKGNLIVEDFFRLTSSTISVTGTGTITPTTSYVKLDPDDDYTLAGSPIIAAGTEGDLLILVNIDSTYYIRIPIGGNVKVSGSSYTELVNYGSITLIYDGTYWVEKGSERNLF